MTLQKPAGTDKSEADHQRHDTADQLYNGEKQQRYGGFCVTRFMLI